MRDRVTDTEHAMRRAREEARLAMLAVEPAVAHAHRSLSVLHADRARRLLGETKPSGSAFPQFSPPRADIIELHELQARFCSG